MLVNFKIENFKTTEYRKSFLDVCCKQKQFFYLMINSVNQLSNYVAKNY